MLSGRLQARAERCRVDWWITGGLKVLVAGLVCTAMRVMARSIVQLVPSRPNAMHPPAPQSRTRVLKCGFEMETRLGALGVPLVGM